MTGSQASSFIGKLTQCCRHLNAMGTWTPVHLRRNWQSCSSRAKARFLSYSQVPNSGKFLGSKSLLVLSMNVACITNKCLHTFACKGSLHMKFTWRVYTCCETRSHAPTTTQDNNYRTTEQLNDCPKWGKTTQSRPSNIGKRMKKEC